MIQASVKQSKMHATASSGNSISQPTEQSMQFDVQFSFLLDVNSVGTDVAAPLDVEALDFDVDAPTFTPAFAADDVDGP